MALARRLLPRILLATGCLLAMFALPLASQAPAPQPAATATPAPDARPAPAPPKNLRVLPRDWTRQQVIDNVMTRWTADLGVRCQHCHVGGEDLPMAQWDFAADDKPTKQRAREMVQMLEEINRRLGAMTSLHGPGTPPPSATCFTCHRGQPQPRRIEDVFEEVRATSGTAAAIARYRELRASRRDAGGYDFSVKPLVKLARMRLDAGDGAGAGEVLALARELGFDSLSVRVTAAQAAAAAGDLAAAKEHLDKAAEKAANLAEREFVQEQRQELLGEAPP